MNVQDDHEPIEAEAGTQDELDVAFEIGTMSHVEVLLDQAIAEVDSARAMPMSSSVMVNREELLGLLLNAREGLPRELKEARWLLKERQEYLDRTDSEADEILESARAQAEQMVQRTEIIKGSEQRARKIVEHAEDEARRLRLECEDFCDQRLAQFEIVLERTMKMVTAGREKQVGS